MHWPSFDTRVRSCERLLKHRKDPQGTSRPVKKLANRRGQRKAIYGKKLSGWKESLSLQLLSYHTHGSVQLATEMMTTINANRSKEGRSHPRIHFGWLYSNGLKEGSRVSIYRTRIRSRSNLDEHRHSGYCIMFSIGEWVIDKATDAVGWTLVYERYDDRYLCAWLKNQLTSLNLEKVQNLQYSSITQIHLSYRSTRNISTPPPTLLFAKHIVNHYYALGRHRPPIIPHFFS